MSASTSSPPSSFQMNVEVDGGQVACPTSASNPGTLLGIGFGAT
jgi:hypothetical protein